MTTEANTPSRTAAVTAPAGTPTSVIARLAGRFGVDQDKMLTCLKGTAFKGNCTNEQLMALCIVADQYGLNPWTKEIYAFPDKNNGIVPVVGVDGWARIINEHPQFDGIQFTESGQGKDLAVTCTIHRKDRTHPTVITERLSECYRDNTAPWKSHPSRMLRHKALIQAARYAFGFAGIYDQDEAERIIGADAAKTVHARPGHSPLENVQHRDTSPAAQIEPPPLPDSDPSSSSPGVHAAQPENAEPEAEPDDTPY